MLGRRSVNLDDDQEVWLAQENPKVEVFPKGSTDEMESVSIQFEDHGRRGVSRPTGRGRHHSDACQGRSKELIGQGTLVLQQVVLGAALAPKGSKKESAQVSRRSLIGRRLEHTCTFTWCQ